MIPNVFICISGAAKTGKTHLALSFPPPIAIYSFDLRGAELLVQKPVFKDKDITVKKFVLPISMTTDAEQADHDFWEKIKADYIETVESQKFATIILDPATFLWEIIRNAYTWEQSRQRLMRRDYGEPNSRMTGMLTMPLVSGTNVVSINYRKAVYKADQDTGETDVDGFTRTPALADVVLVTSAGTRLSTPTEKKETGKDKQNITKVRIERCRFDRTLDGEVLIDPDYNDLIALLGAS